MNITEAFIPYLETVTGSIFGQGLHIGGIPISAPEAGWWVVSSGGSPESDNQTGEKIKNYTLDIFYRSSDEKEVYDNLQSLEETINSDGCTQLNGYNVIDMTATLFNVDQDIDNEDRKVGLIQVNLRTYKE